MPSKPSREAGPTPEAQLRFLTERFGPSDQKLIRTLRSALRKRLPTANELVYDYKTFFVITYSSTDHPIAGIVSLAARADGMRLYFMNGPSLPDPKKLLTGSGKEVRFIRVESARHLKHPDVEALIAATIDLANFPLPSKGPGGLIIKTFGPKKRPSRKSTK